MVFFQNREEVRGYFFRVWHKKNGQLHLDQLETIVADVINSHPEYHIYMQDKDVCLLSDFSHKHNQTNPFLHMGMHITLKEQINSNRPTGIKSIFQHLAAHSLSVHDAEHKMMECLGRILWEAKQQHRLPDENDYLACLKKSTGS